MKLEELWSLSRTSYEEVAFRSNKQSSGGISGLGVEDGNQKRFKMILRSAKISKVAFAVFGSIGAAIPFLDFVAFPGPESLVSAISLSLAISLAYIVFYSLQVLPEFTNSEAFSLLFTMPLCRRDFSVVAVFSFLRTFDYLVIGTGLLQVFLIYFLTHSIAATLLMFLGAIVNAIFASAIALWFSGLFYRKVSHASSSRSKAATIGRLMFLVVWGFAAMSIGFLFNILSYMLPFINDALAGGYSSLSGITISLLHPFAISLAITSLYYSPTLLSATSSAPQIMYFMLPFVSSTAYALIAFLVGRRTYLAISNVAHSATKANSLNHVTSKDFQIKIRRPILAQIFKDLRLASKNPSMAFLYALPVFVVFMLAIITEQFPVMHASSIIVSTVVGCSFTIMICTTLLNTEGGGLEYSFSLPIKIREVISAKTLVATLMFLPVPLALIALGLSKELTSYYSLLIPVIEVVAVYSACMAEITMFFGTGRSRGFSAVAGAGIMRLVLSLATALVIFIIPLGSYAIEYTLSSSHVFAIFAMLVTASIEFVVVSSINRGVTRSSH